MIDDAAAGIPSRRRSGQNLGPRPRLNHSGATFFRGDDGVVIFSIPRRGLLVIEVKDWKLENIRSMDKLTARFRSMGAR
jgi:hypothetical protein